MRQARRRVLAWALAAASPCAARPLTLTDLQRLEGVTRAYASPAGDRLVLETAAPYREAGVFDDDRLIVLARTRLFTLDPFAARPRLTTLAARPGCTSLGFSPSGRSLAIGCLQSRHLRLGVADLRRATVRWSAEAVFAPRNGPSLRWVDEHRVLLLEPAGDPDRLTFPNGVVGQAGLQDRRRRQAAGRGGGPLVFGSGAFADRPAEDTRVVVADLATGRRRVLGRGSFDDLELAPSGRWAALTGPGGPPDLAAVSVVGVSDVLAKRRLTLLDLASGRLSRPAPTLDLAPTVLAWSGDDRLLIFARRDRTTGWSDGRYVVLDPRRPTRPVIPLTAARPFVGAYGTEAFPVARGGWLRAPPRGA